MMHGLRWLIMDAGNGLVAPISLLRTAYQTAGLSGRCHASMVTLAAYGCMVWLHTCACCARLPDSRFVWLVPLALDLFVLILIGHIACRYGCLLAPSELYLVADRPSTGG